MSILASHIRILGYLAIIRNDFPIMFPPAATWTRAVGLRGPQLILKDEILVVKKYINKHLNKGFIYLNISLVAAPILLIKKLKGGI